MQVMNSYNTTFNPDLNNSTINTGLHIIMTTDEDDARPVYISGNFNNWRTQDKDFLMEKIGNSSYHYKFSHDFDYPAELLYKFTKGDWSEVEIDSHGNRTENRSTLAHTGIQKEHVERWRKNWLPFKQSFLPQVQLISDEFEIPQLNKTRKIWALLPHDYDNSSESYPVMYLQDAQNLFNETAEFGNWEIDKKLAVMSEYKIGKIIIIAIEHAEEDRIKEYNVGKTILGKGQGKKYIRFVTDTLKPYVDSHFRTKKEREFTGIGGSSMGGLVSIFSGLRNPEVYGKLMIFSPSLWVIQDLKIKHKKTNAEDTKIYLYAGGDESATMIEHTKKLKEDLIDSEFIKDNLKINLSINRQGKHSETYWSDEFPKAIEWLFFQTK
ncbi:Predicted hydrolase of the alpha/beta superfamily [Flavobacterium omnivorum]|uniref:Predicted hydrolase of the alpha/beta superfamily n=1 Tax=Flavobacterium omnivorum TaxID=178355 RepID=A0A1G7ZVI1_9FLAO|nr:alpha/beta hydrolase-fold protein [Flavobacterium omnivorum]SDH12652.1 Predicted hydrolase of the alpha/beta superfamily [Flavobacterium omnivorum]